MLNIESKRITKEINRLALMQAYLPYDLFKVRRDKVIGDIVYIEDEKGQAELIERFNIKLGEC